MSVDRLVPARETTTAIKKTAARSPGSHRTVPRGLIAGTLAILGLTWGPYVLIPGQSLLLARVQTGVYLGLFLLTIFNRRAKVLLARTFQRYTLNPLFRSLLAIGINPLGLAILETTGAVTGKTRRVPVGNGRQGDDFWIIAEHGFRAGYVRNIQHNPHVRVRLRTGLRYRWVPGTATVLPDDDALARQRRIIAWHPLRAYNAVNVRMLGADLLTVYVRLDLGQARHSAKPARTAAARPATR